LSDGFRPHSPKQEAALFSNKKILACLTGIQYGKTTIGSVRQKIRMHRFTDPNDAFIICAPTYKIMQQSTLPAFLKIMEGYGEYSKADAVFRMHGGGTCYMRTATEPDSIVGITNVRGIWVDEAGKVSLYFWENVVARSAFRDCPIDLTSSPYTLNWLFKEIVRPKLKDPTALPHVDLVQAASWENPYMPQSTIDHAKSTMDARRFNALFGGKWERMAGLVYDCFDELENQVDAFALPEGTRYVGGIDWGFTEPFVFKVRAITPDGRHFGVSEFYKSGLTIKDMIEVVKQRQRIFDIGPVYCGPDQPGYIEEMTRHGIRAQPANNDVRLGIDRHYELLKTRRLKYFRATHPYTLDELDTYHYPDPDDVKPDENVRDAKPVQQNDHALDADRYISIMTALGAKRHVAVVADETQKQESHAQRIDRLKRKARVGGSSENW
jgi:hypothetical protein